MKPLSNKRAIVTGATQGIGKAIATALVSAGVITTLVGRYDDRLECAKRDLESFGRDLINTALVDLSDAKSIALFASEFTGSAPELHVLVNCGGQYMSGSWVDVQSDDFTAILKTNVIGPAALTRALLPMLIESQGDVVFINSSIVRHAGGRAGVFAASQHSLRAVADSLREEVNDLGVRVLSVYPGRTATPRQKTIHENAGQLYQPDRLLQPRDIADAVVACLMLNDTAEVTDLHLRQRYKA